MFLLFRCECNDGYSGINCEIEESDCKENPCPDRAMCRDEPGVGNFTCLCKSGYAGDKCDITVNPCDSNPCKNEANCESQEQVHNILFFNIVITYS